MEVKYCYGCGIELQTNEPSEIGYIPPEILEEKKQDSLCQRCFQLTNYGHTDKAVINIDHKTIFEDIKKDKALVVYVIDLLNVPYSMIKEINESIKGLKVLLVANKFDLVPGEVREEKIVAWLKKVAEEYNLDILSTFVCSASTNYSIRELMTEINRLRAGKNVYFIGAANVGKSSIINALLKNYSNNTGQFISVSRYPGTTLSKIEIPIDDNSCLYDTPGFINPRSMACWIPAKKMETILPNKKIKPQVWQLDSKQSFFLGSLARVDYLSTRKASLVTMFAPAVEIHRTKLANADKVAKNMLGKLLPSNPSIKTMEDFSQVNLSLTVENKMDLMITGYGTVTIIGQGNHQLTVHVPPGVEVIVIESMI